MPRDHSDVTWSQLYPHVTLSLPRQHHTTWPALSKQHTAPRPSFVKKQGQVRLDLADLSLSLAQDDKRTQLSDWLVCVTWQEYSSVIGSDLTMKTVLLLLIVVSSVVARERNINMDQLKGMRKLLKQLDSGVFTTCNIVFFKVLIVARIQLSDWLARVKWL